MKKNKFKFTKPEISNSMKLRNRWLKKGVELINITSLCETKMGCSGWGNSFNEPEESIHHIQIWYRDENIGVISGNNGYIIDNDKYIFHIDNNNGDFIIFRKVYNKR